MWWRGWSRGKRPMGRMVQEWGKCREEEREQKGTERKKKALVIRILGQVCPSDKPKRDVQRDLFMSPHCLKLLFPSTRGYWSILYSQQFSLAVSVAQKIGDWWLRQSCTTDQRSFKSEVNGLNSGCLNSAEPIVLFLTWHSINFDIQSNIITLKWLPPNHVDGTVSCSRVNDVSTATLLWCREFSLRVAPGLPLSSCDIPGILLFKMPVST